MKRLGKRKGVKDRRRKWIYPEFEMTMAMADDPLGLYLTEQLASAYRSAFLKGFTEGFRAAEKRRRGST